MRSDQDASGDNGVEVSADEPFRDEIEVRNEEASRQAGFDVVTPSFLPEGFEFQAVQVHLAPEGQETTLPYVRQTFVRAGSEPGQIIVTQMPIHLEYPANDDRSQPIDAADLQFEVWKTGEEGSLAYTAMDASRTFVLHFVGVIDVSDDVALDVIRSIPE
jgi:hypothetical protein